MKFHLSLFVAFFFRSIQICLAYPFSANENTTTTIDNISGAYSLQSKDDHQEFPEVSNRSNQNNNSIWLEKINKTEDERHNDAFKLHSIELSSYSPSNTVSIPRSADLGENLNNNESSAKQAYFLGSTNEAIVGRPSFPDDVEVFQPVANKPSYIPSIPQFPHFPGMGFRPTNKPSVVTVPILNVDEFFRPTSKPIYPDTFTTSYAADFYHQNAEIFTTNETGNQFNNWLNSVDSIEEDVETKNRGEILSNIANLLRDNRFYETIKLYSNLRNNDMHKINPKSYRFDDEITITDPGKDVLVIKLKLPLNSKEMNVEQRLENKIEEMPVTTDREQNVKIIAKEIEEVKRNNATVTQNDTKFLLETESRSENVVTTEPNKIEYKNQEKIYDASPVKNEKLTNDIEIEKIQSDLSNDSKYSKNLEETSVENEAQITFLSERQLKSDDYKTNAVDVLETDNNPNTKINDTQMNENENLESNIVINKNSNDIGEQVKTGNLDEYKPILDLLNAVDKQIMEDGVIINADYKRDDQNTYRIENKNENYVETTTTYPLIINNTISNIDFDTSTNKIITNAESKDLISSGIEVNKQKNYKIKLPDEKFLSSLDSFNKNQTEEDRVFFNNDFNFKGDSINGEARSTDNNDDDFVIKKTVVDIKKMVSSTEIYPFMHAATEANINLIQMQKQSSTDEIASNFNSKETKFENTNELHTTDKNFPMNENKHRTIVKTLPHIADKPSNIQESRVIEADNVTKTVEQLDLPRLRDINKNETTNETTDKNGIIRGNEWTFSETRNAENDEERNELNYEQSRGQSADHFLPANDEKYDNNNTNVKESRNETKNIYDTADNSLNEDDKIKFIKFCGTSTNARCNSSDLQIMLSLAKPRSRDEDNASKEERMVRILKFMENLRSQKLRYNI